MVSNRRLSNGEERSIGARPFLRLAQGVSIDGVLEDFTKIAAEKGIGLCGVRFTRANLEREFKLPDAGDRAGKVCELDIGVEGGQTHLIVKFHEPLDNAIRYELEDAACLAAHRLELLAGNRLRIERAGKGSEASPLIEGLVGKSEPMRRLGRAILTSAGGNSTVLITGESGTGKELVARAIHFHSTRASRPFVAVNCGALPEPLIESELFGHERGAFTGADRQRKGRFELAHTGTLFLDEIGELPLAMQSKLLRVLQERQFERLGGAQTLTVDARVIAATNRDLLREVDERRFRQDLYYRLHVLALRTPALRDHPADIPLLVGHFLDVVGRRLEFGLRPEVEEEAIELLCRYRWPGNVRELEAMLERLAAEAGDGQVITVAQVRRETALEDVITPGDIEYHAVLYAGESLDAHLGRQELAIYQMVRDRCGGNHSQAARRLGVGRTAFYNRLGRRRQRSSGH